MQNDEKKKVFFSRFRKKRSLFREKEHRLKKSPKFCILFKGVSPWFLPKNGDF